HEGLFGEAHFFDVLTQTAAHHLLDDVGRLAAFGGLGGVDLAFFGQYVSRYVFRIHHQRVGGGDVHGDVARQFLVAAVEGYQYGDLVVGVNIGAHGLAFATDEHGA